MTLVVPRRIVLKSPERHWNVQNDMVTAFFHSQGLESPIDDLYIHILFEPSSPSNLFFVLDLYCKSNPDVDLSKVDLQIFKVSKRIPLYVEMISCFIKLA